MEEVYSKNVYQTKFIENSLTPLYNEITPSSFGMFSQEEVYLKIELLNKQDRVESVLGYSITPISFNDFSNVSNFSVPLKK